MEGPSAHSRSHGRFCGGATCPIVRSWAGRSGCVPPRSCSRWGGMEGSITRWHPFRCSAGFVRRPGSSFFPLRHGNRRRRRIRRPACARARTSASIVGDARRSGGAGSVERGDRTCGIRSHRPRHRPWRPECSPDVRDGSPDAPRRPRSARRYPCSSGIRRARSRALGLRLPALGPDGAAHGNRAARGCAARRAGRLLSGPQSNLPVLRGYRVLNAYVALTPAGILDIESPIAQRLAGAAWRKDRDGWTRVALPSPAFGSCSTGGNRRRCSRSWRRRSRSHGARRWADPSRRSRCSRNGSRSRGSPRQTGRASRGVRARASRHDRAVSRRMACCFGRRPGARRRPGQWWFSGMRRRIRLVARAPDVRTVEPSAGVLDFRRDTACRRAARRGRFPATNQQGRVNRDALWMLANTPAEARRRSVVHGNVSGHRVRISSKRGSPRSESQSRSCSIHSRNPPARLTHRPQGHQPLLIQGFRGVSALARVALRCEVLQP